MAGFGAAAFVTASDAYQAAEDHHGAHPLIWTVAGVVAALAIALRWTVVLIKRARGSDIDLPRWVRPLTRDLAAFVPSLIIAAAIVRGGTGAGWKPGLYVFVFLLPALLFVGMLLSMAFEKPRGITARTGQDSAEGLDANVG